MYPFAAGVQEDVIKHQEYLNSDELRDGDIIFQTSQSGQSKAIQLATHSRYSHMGLIYEKEGELYVFEAVQPVKFTPLQDWINRGENGHYVAKRFVDGNRTLNQLDIRNMKAFGERYLGKDYDIYFEWSDDRIYCSELVWKLYKEVLNVELGELETLADFDLSDERVKQKMTERYGNNIPTEEKVISPAAMFNSDKLVVVKSN